MGSSNESTMEGGDPNVELLAARQKQLIRQALTTRFAAFLKPGERLELDAEKSDEYVYATIRVTTPDDSFRLDVEASVLAADQNDKRLEQKDAFLELVIEFLKRQLYEFFRQDREERFHIDWRIYPTEKAKIRFRGQIRKPSLEREADELLDQPED